MTFVEISINLARIARCTYQRGDAHGAPYSRLKNRVLSLIIDPIKTKKFLEPLFKILEIDS
ncbi:Isoprenoid synthase domain containing protein [Parasponia andersonii]|uniref:Isoprenoid synthase domain containing protein n=1 Tax=Parasponia andersonii TaxID=3476 RepID=A0A2P5BIE5_PARAD|nr:Isoprenoid synthase domain containing protein [Parasponia andersonii]